MQNKVIYDNSGINLSFKSYVSKVFGFVALGLLISGVISYFTATNFQVLAFILGPLGTIILVIAELGIAIFFSARLMSMNKRTAYICYFLYSILTGLSLSFIFAAYDIKSITFAFVSTTVLFICMAILGHNTNLDLTKASSYLFGGLISIIISTLLNVLIFKSSTFDLIISYVAVIIFLVLIAYHMQKLRNLYNAGLNDGELYEKLLILGSFQLYLDFINLFLQILSIFSRRRRD